MYQIFAILIVIASILLIGVILIQKSKGGGLATNVNNYNQFMGVRKTTDFVEKATWGLAAFICALSIMSAFVAPKILDSAPQLKKLPTSETQAPSFDTQAQEAPAAQTATEPAQATVPAKESKTPEGVTTTTTKEGNKTVTTTTTTLPAPVDKAPEKSDKKKSN